MTVSVAVRNLAATEMAPAPGFPVLAAGATQTVSYKTVNYDDYRAGLLAAVNVGAEVTFDGTNATGVVTLNATGQLTATQKVAVVDNTSGANAVISLPAAGGISEGHQVYIRVEDEGGFAVTIDGDGTDTIDGSGTAVATAAGDILRYRWDGTSDWVSF